MSRVLDLTGRVFGRLTVLRRAGSQKAHATWWCRCECGVECVRGSSAIQRAASCGCGKLVFFGPKESEPAATRIDHYIDRSGGEGACWPWTGYTQNGYGVLKYGRRGSSPVRAHRVAYELAHGLIPEGLFVCHHCDNPPCCNPAHLFVGTAADNAQDMVAKGRHGSIVKRETRPRGERNPSSKLTEESVRQIRREWAAGGVRQRDLAKRFGVDKQVVWSVIHRLTWAHVL